MSGQNNFDPGTTHSPEGRYKTPYPFWFPGSKSPLLSCPPSKSVRLPGIRNSSSPAVRPHKPYSRIFLWHHRSAGKPPPGYPMSSSHPGKPPLPHQTSLYCTQGIPYPYPWAHRRSGRRSPWHCLTQFPRNARYSSLDPHRHTGSSHPPASRSPRILGSHLYASRKYPEAGWIPLPRPSLSSIHPSL